MLISGERDFAKFHDWLIIYKGKLQEKDNNDEPRYRASLAYSYPAELDNAEQEKLKLMIVLHQLLRMLNT